MTMMSTLSCHTREARNTLTQLCCAPSTGANNKKKKYPKHSKWQMSEKTVAYVAFTSIVLQRARDVQWLLYCYVCGVAARLLCARPYNLYLMVFFISPLLLAILISCYKRHRFPLTSTNNLYVAPYEFLCGVICVCSFFFSG